MHSTRGFHMRIASLGPEVHHKERNSPEQPLRSKARGKRASVSCQKTSVNGSCLLITYLQLPTVDPCEEGFTATWESALLDSRST